MKHPYEFPKDFLWACATASYQVEGAANEDGRGPSIWDTFSHSPGLVDNDDNADVSSDQYHRYKEDIALMKWMGVKAYRFSISWSRIFPDGSGTVNEKGLTYYQNLIDELLANGIEPWVTCFHWDLPQKLEDQFGGWRSQEICRYFADYVGFVTKKISDRVRHIFTINEFRCFTDNAYYLGLLAPGLKLSRAIRNQARHNALLAHGMAVRAIRDNAKQDVKVGIAENSEICVPLMETPEHVAAARKAMREMNGHFLTAIMEGAYPECYLTDEGPDAPEFTDEQMKIIGEKLDFVGINAYYPTIIRARDNSRGYEVIEPPESYPKMNMPWAHIGPQVAYWPTRFLKEIWDVNDVYITENGCAAKDKLTPDKEVLDTDRMMFLREHFIWAQRAVREELPLKGYFVWSLLDNFEWARGFSKRFGLVYVNYRTLERTPKLSAHFYKQVIEQSAVV